LKEKKIRMMRCPNYHYSLREKCPVCGLPTSTPHPKYSPEDKYGEYRRKILYGV